MRGAWQCGRRHQRWGETRDKERRLAGRQWKRDLPHDPVRFACLRRLAAAIHIFETLSSPHRHALPRIIQLLATPTGATQTSSKLTIFQLIVLPISAPCCCCLLFSVVRLLLIPCVAAIFISAFSGRFYLFCCCFSQIIIKCRMWNILWKRNQMTLGSFLSRTVFVTTFAIEENYLI